VIDSGAIGRVSDRVRRLRVGTYAWEDDMAGIVKKIPLPGIGIRYDFVTGDGARVGVVHLRSGVRELVLFEREDPDTSHNLLRLSAEDSRTLAELLGSVLP
jgi:hypothetical protein